MPCSQVDASGADSSGADGARIEHDGAAATDGRGAGVPGPGGDVLAPGAAVDASGPDGSDGAPALMVSPTSVAFGMVHGPSAEERPITVRNVGSGVLRVEGLLLTGSAYYTVSFDDDADPATPEVSLSPGPLYTPPGPIELGAGETLTITVRYAPLTSDAATASLLVLSNDPAHPLGVEVLLYSATDPPGPCLKVNPKTVNFGLQGVGDLSVLPVVLQSCGTSPVEITSIALDPATSSPDFSLDLTPLPGIDDGGAISAAAPLVIPVNAKAEFDVRFVPGSENPKDEAGQAIPDIGTIHIATSSGQTVPVELRGVGVAPDWPLAVIVHDQGEEVIPQTVLHLKGDQSFAPSSPIAAWQWSVEQPEGSHSKFVPSPTFPNPAFELNVVGMYTFRLSVWDESGASSKAPAEAVVVVLPDEAIHVELLWITPDDPDPIDEGPAAGGDVDLHFLHPNASGPDLDGDGAPDGYFDKAFDCFWFNPNPNWGNFDPAVKDDPGLHREDSAAPGPEIVGLGIPEAGTTYRIGVQYWHDHGMGPSLVSLRVFVYGTLVFEREDVKLLNHDMWDVGVLDWTAAKVTPITGMGGGDKITPNYENPFFFAP